MSAYIVDRSVILSLVKGALQLDITNAEFALHTANMLWAENIKSVSARYPGESSAMLPGPVGETFIITEEEITATEAPNPEQLLELIRKYSYQSCEHDGWKVSPSCGMMIYLRAAADAALVVWNEEQAQARLHARHIAQLETDRYEAEGRAIMEGRTETHCIIAELHEDESDSQTDYFNSRTTRTVVLALSKHGKDLFSEMRKAAALFTETAHLATGGSEIEHREKYSMGKGYYLQEGWSYSGWRVSKSVMFRREWAAIGRGDHTLTLKAPARAVSEPVAAPAPTVAAYTFLPEFANACYIG